MPKARLPRTNLAVRHRLAWLDHLAYALFQATGRCQLVQCVWLYDRQVDMAALAQTTDRLAALAFNRLVEPSRLPLARPRWVKPAGGAEPIQLSGASLPRSRLLYWAKQHARAPFDIVAGPAWRVAVQKFDDGSMAVSIVGSHLILDGMGALLAIEAAANGKAVPNVYLAKGARGGLTGYLSDAWQILVDAPRTSAALIRIALAACRGPILSGQRIKMETKPAALPSAVVELAAVAISVDAVAWDACARRLGGLSNPLLPGFVATLAAHLGRRRPSDGTVSLLIPVDTRQGLEDDRALAIKFQKLIVTPEAVTQDLRPINAALRALLRDTIVRQDDHLALLMPAIAWMPRTVVSALLKLMFTYADDRPVSCSNLGLLSPELGCIDGAPASKILTLAVDVNVTHHDLERSYGHLVVVASRYGQCISLCVEACQLTPNPTTTDELRTAVEHTLANFGIDAVIYA